MAIAKDKESGEIRLRIFELAEKDARIRPLFTLFTSLITDYSLSKDIKRSVGFGELLSKPVEDLEEIIDKIAVEDQLLLTKEYKFGGNVREKFWGVKIKDDIYAGVVIVPKIYSKNGIIYYARLAVYISDVKNEREFISKLLKYRIINANKAEAYRLSHVFSPSYNLIKDLIDYVEITNVEDIPYYLKKDVKSKYDEYLRDKIFYSIAYHIVETITDSRDIAKEFVRILMLYKKNLAKSSEKSKKRNSSYLL